jgi:hypothetical protein
VPSSLLFHHLNLAITSLSDALVAHNLEIFEFSPNGFESDVRTLRMGLGSAFIVLRCVRVTSIALRIVLVHVFKIGCFDESRFEMRFFMFFN